MDQPDLHVYVTTAYAIAGASVLLLVVVSVLRARRARKTLMTLESDHEA